MPDPLQIARALGAHEVDNVAIRGHVAGRTFRRAAVPPSVPGKPFTVRFHPPFDQDRRAELGGVPGPGLQIVVERAGYDPGQRKCFFRTILLGVRAQHQADIWHLPEAADPIAGFARKFAGLEPVVRKENPARLRTGRLFETGDVGRSHVMFRRILPCAGFVEIESLIQLSRRWR